MKKVFIGLMVVGSFVFASESMSGCVETKLSEKTSLFSCPSGDYKATYEVAYKKRVLTSEPELELIGKKEPTIINQYSK